MSFENCYVSTNSNQTPNVVHWGRNNLICYGSCNSVLIYDPNVGGGGKVMHTLVGHSKRVNSVKWLSGVGNLFETELVSGSTDSLVFVWTLKGGIYESVTLKGHESNVNIVDGLYKENDTNKAIIVSASMDCTVIVWYRPKPTDTFELHQRINFGYSIAVGLKISFLPNDNQPILACALDNSKIQVYVQTGIENKFDCGAQLSGHEDWVRGLDFASDVDDLLLVSSSQDTFIRLWRFTNKDLVSDLVEDTSKVDNEKTQLRVDNKKYNIYLESVLTGHEGWVYSVNWSPVSLQILSASIDKSLIIWEFDKVSGLWLEKVRMGEVGGNTLGFYGGVFGPDGKQVCAHSYHGAFHIWAYFDKLETWNPSVTIGGHFSEVVDCAWEPKGEYLFSTSSDQTTRIHAPWPSKKEPITWHEIARPQVHGYDMSCLAVLSRYKFASGAEEKVIRTFEAPKNFVDNFRRICQVSEDPQGDAISGLSTFIPKGASVPSLGLSNKAVYTDDNIEQAVSVDKRNPYPEESHFVATDLIEPPTEETLLQNTLWPEVQKLYGHGYEVFALAASPDGKYLASSCKSTKPEHAAILLWDTSSWQQIQKLMSHTLTVVQMQFSPDSLHLLSVSRDRRWSLFTRNDQKTFELAATTDKSTGVHTRIIWTCSWSHDSKYFATGSRDGKAVIWTINKGKQKTNVLGECEMVSKPLELKNESVTAIAFAPGFVSEYYLVAVGFESGVIRIFKWNAEGWKEVLLLIQSFAHHLTVRKLCFRPVFGKGGYNDNDKNVMQLASCSSDYSVRICNIFLNKLS
ncbi:hypothetical protein NQ315_013422 [Exocentrus adspersus]|uniref:Elongator complex protein 2 n=1 Tax=Exocentrus adspersus TaxID=1586481 RepID=A0AAV8VHP5_9CUCU|nr:hypothetical protein NQ315_013422 [Exocentrus adspersus]